MRAELFIKRYIGFIDGKGALDPCGLCRWPFYGPSSGVVVLFCLALWFLLRGLWLWHSLDFYIKLTFLL